MDAEVERQLIGRVLGHLARKTSDDGAGETRLASAEYLDPGRLAAERSSIFARCPTMVAPAAALPGPGAFVTSDEHGVPLLATRDAAGRAHVFVNACVHRGTRLVDEPAGTRTSFVCPYHAWAYATDGRLLGLHLPRAFPDTSCERPALVELPAIERAGMVWAALEAPTDSALDLELGALEPELEDLARRYPVAHAHEVRTWRANWKIFVDGGLETYHFRIAHRDTIAPRFHDDVLVRDRVGPHQRMVLPRRTFATLGESPHAPGSLRTHANLVYFVFPNQLLLVQEDHLIAIATHPVGVDESRITLTMRIAEEPADEDETARDYWEKHWRLTRHVLAEDFTIGERIQRGLASGHVRELRLGRGEVGLAEFHAEVAARLPRA